MTLHIFNPSHDEALGFGSPYYVPTKAAQRMAAERCTLPELWAGAGDFILLPDECERPAASVARVSYVYKRELTPTLLQQISHLQPWGWDAYLRHTLRRCGVSDEFLPTDEYLADLRRLSSRQTAVSLLNALKSANPEYTGEAHWCSTLDDAVTAINRYPQAMVKSPWSSSGRGVFRVDANAFDAPTLQRIANIVRQHGGVAVERYCKRLQDFALEFYALPDGSIEYAGLSVFNTSVGGNYLGNISGTQAELQQLLAHHYPWSRIEECIEQLSALLPRLFEGKYTGPFGIDMMLVDETAEVKLNPCVEINLRNTMGHVQLMMQQRECKHPCH